MALNVQIQNKGTFVIIAPSGDVDLNVSREFQTHIKKAMESRPQKLIVDLAGVPYMDSSGVATLVEAMQIARKASTRLILCRLQDKVRSIFEIARLDRVFTIMVSVEAASE